MNLLFTFSSTEVKILAESYVSHQEKGMRKERMLVNVRLGKAWQSRQYR